MTWLSAALSAITAIFKAASAWLSERRDKMLVSLGRSQQTTTDLQGRIDALQEANRIRENTLTQLDRGGNERLRDDDGFERKADD